ncbi:MAG: DUF1571 domain-containing protein [Bacteroidales bacterium]|nr:DUF1571 domain-containing protein [Bacteroidales bacterium]
MLLVFHLSFSQTVDEILDKTFKNIESANTLRLVIISRERFFNNYKTDKGIYKISRNPILYYYKQLIPNSGAEVLVNSEIYPMAWVNANEWMIPTLKLSPFGAQLRDTRHHNLYHAGFDYFKKILCVLKDKYSINWDKIVSLDMNAKLQEYDCYKLEIINPYYKIINFKIQQPTTPQELALKLNICDFSILELNPSIENIFKKLTPGQVIKIPNDYAQKIIIYIDKKLMLPRKIQVYDTKGLWEEYFFESIEVNSKFCKEEFSKNYKEYGF